MSDSRKGVTGTGSGDAAPVVGLESVQLSIQRQIKERRDNVSISKAGCS